MIHFLKFHQKQPEQIRKFLAEQQSWAGQFFVSPITKIGQIIDKNSLLREHIFVIFSPTLDYTSTCNKMKQNLTKKAHDSH